MRKSAVAVVLAYAAAFSLLGYSLAEGPSAHHVPRGAGVTGATGVTSAHAPGWGAVGPPASQQYAVASSVGTSPMYDSITLGEIPSHPFAAAGYVGGSWVTYPEIRHTWPGTHAVSIAVNASERGDCIDVEPLDANPWEVDPWLERHMGDCVYSDWFEFTTEVDPDLARAGLHPWKWDADYTNVPHIDAGFNATQWTQNCLGRNLDCSRVQSVFLSIATPPVVTCNARCQTLERDIARREANRKASLAHMRADLAHIRAWEARRRHATRKQVAELDHAIHVAQDDRHHLEAVVKADERLIAQWRRELS